MAVKQASTSQIPLQKRLSFKFALLFLGTFLAVFFIGAVYDVFSQFRESSTAEATLAAQPEPIVIDPKLQADLAKVMAFDTIPSETAVSDPFVDRSGISGSISTTGGTPSTQASIKGTTGSATTAGMLTKGGSTPTIAGSVSNLSPASENTKMRYDAWQKANLNADGMPNPRIFAVEDLVPVGIVSGGRGTDEVMLLSLSLCRTFSFPAGTEFYDAYLTNVSRDFVIFNLKGLPRAVTKSYSTTALCETKEETQAVTSADQPKPPGY
jgi:hypothetical protein